MKLSQNNRSQDNPKRVDRDKKLFDSIAEGYFGKDVSPASRYARSLRVTQTFRRIPETGLPRILEAGCGGGFSASYLAGTYSSFLGFDYSKELISLANTFNSSDFTKFIEGDATTIVFDEEFDVLLLIGVIHHIDSPELALKNLIRFLRPGGWVAVNEPQRSNPLIRAARAARKALDRNYSDEQDQYSPNELTQLLSAAGLENVQLSPQGFFSTPFAEVIMPLQGLMKPISHVACELDRRIERQPWPALMATSWNIIGVGRVPDI